MVAEGPAERPRDSTSEPAASDGRQIVQVAERPISEREFGLEAEEPESPRAGFDWTWLAFLVIVLVALGLRLFDLGGRAMHHDESLHAVYSWYLYVGRGYVHDPMMHGPWLFHTTALMYMLFGDSEVTARLPEVLLGTAMVGLPFFLRRELGRLGAIGVSVLLALGPAFLYFSRFAREDALAAFETLLLVVGLFGWIRSRKAGWLYTAAAAFAILFANKEISFIVGFTFVTFFLVVAGLEYRQSGTGPVSRAILDIGTRQWAISFAIFLGISALLYTTFFTNMEGLCTAIWSAPLGSCVGRLGALQYWAAQQDVARGGQPWFYYFLITPIYQPLALILSIASLFLVRRRTVFYWFCLWWAALSILIYSYAGEKMPWLLLHVALPLVLLAGLAAESLATSLQNPWGLLGRQWALSGLIVVGLTGLVAWAAAASVQDTALGAQTQALRRIALGAVVLGIGAWGYRVSGGLSRRQVAGSFATVGIGLLVLYEIRTSWQLNYKNGDTPVEMLVYVQSSPDVPFVVNELTRISAQLGQRKEAPILLDGGYTETLAGQNVPHEAISWPFEWYLRDWKTKQYYQRDLPVDFSTGKYAAVLVMAPNLDPIRDQLSGYTGHKFRLNWWYPEDYKQLSPPDTNNSIQALFKTFLDGESRVRFFGPLWFTISDPEARIKAMKYLLYRELVNGQLGAREFYFYVRNDLVGLAPAAPQAGTGQAARPATSGLSSEPVAVSAVTSYGKPGGASVLRDPKNVAVGPDGRLYVTDGTNNTITVFNPDGSVARSWGQKGDGDGQFNEPWGIVVASDGSVFVADTWNHRIQKFDSQGRFLSKWGTFADARGQLGNAPGSFYGPRAIALSPVGDLLVTDTGNKRIQVFDRDGRYLRSGGGEGTRPGQFREPVGLAVDAQGQIYVADMWNQRIQVLDQNFDPIAQYSIPAWTSQSALHKAYLAVTPSGEIYATVPERQQILHVKDGTASVLSISGGPRLGLPVGIVVDAARHLRVADAGSGTVVQYDLVPTETAGEAA